MSVRIASVQQDTAEQRYPGVFNIDVLGHSPLRLQRLYPGRASTSIEGPQIYLVDTQHPDFVFAPHFHEVDQFQVFLRGSGRFGKETIKPGSLHYAGAYTPYGPIVSGSDGVAYMTIRTKVDSGAKPMPGSAHLRKRRANRAMIVHADLERPESQALFGPEDDGLEVRRQVIAPNAAFEFLAPRQSGGTAGVIVAGSVTVNQATYAKWACIYAPAGETNEVRAGVDGVDVLLTTFPIPIED